MPRCNCCIDLLFFSKRKDNGRWWEWDPSHRLWTPCELFSLKDPKICSFENEQWRLSKDTENLYTTVHNHNGPSEVSSVKATASIQFWRRARYARLPTMGYAELLNVEETGLQDVESVTKKNSRKGMPPLLAGRFAYPSADGWHTLHSRYEITCFPG